MINFIENHKYQTYGLVCDSYLKLEDIIEYSSATEVPLYLDIVDNSKISNSIFIIDKENSIQDIMNFFDLNLYNRNIYIMNIGKEEMGKVLHLTYSADFVSINNKILKDRFEWN